MGEEHQWQAGLEYSAKAKKLQGMVEIMDWLGFGKDLRPRVIPSLQTHGIYLISSGDRKLADQVVTSFE